VKGQNQHGYRSELRPGGNAITPNQDLPDSATPMDDEPEEENHKIQRLLRNRDIPDIRSGCRFQLTGFDFSIR
jgi:hypothetical protein